MVVGGTAYVRITAVRGSVGLSSEGVRNESVSQSVISAVFASGDSLNGMSGVSSVNCTAEVSVEDSCLGVSLLGLYLSVFQLLEFLCLFCFPCQCSLIRSHIPFSGLLPSLTT